jgi:hypothetical protein
VDTNDLTAGAFDAYLAIDRRTTSLARRASPSKETDPWQPAPKLVTDKDPRELNVKKGDRVRLLQPLWDNVQLYQVDEVILLASRLQPEVDQACLPEYQNVPELPLRQWATARRRRATSTPAPARR